MADAISQLENNPKTCTIKAASQTKGVFIGSYALETIDLGDIEQLPDNGKGATKLAAFGHEIIEQAFKQFGNLPYGPAHQRAMQFEMLVCGHGRSSWNSNTTPDGKTTVTIVWTNPKGDRWQETITIDPDGIILDRTISVK